MFRLQDSGFLRPLFAQSGHDLRLFTIMRHYAYRSDGLSAFLTGTG